jgi:uncharacterized membrane protein YphA (DoxX/SURF4 family)
MQRHFPAFPYGAPGAGLLLLRMATGAIAITQGWLYLADRGNLSPETWTTGLLSLASGALLFVGLLTPIAAALIGIGSLGAAISWLPASIPSLFDAKLPAILITIISTALVLLGPGGCSLDARLHGPREIIIPPPVSPPQR